MRTTSTTQHLGLRRRFATIGIAVAVNLLFLLAYLWSRGGQTTTVVVGISGDTATVSVDGTLQWAYPKVPRVPSRGGIVLTIADTEALSSLPRPRGIASVRVTSAETGDVLFADDFQSGPSSAWQVAGGVITGDGVVGSTGDARLALPAQDWDDVVVEVEYRNVQSASIIVRARSDLYGLVTTVRPFHWNEDATKWLSVGSGRPASRPPRHRPRAKPYTVDEVPRCDADAALSVRTTDGVNRAARGCRPAVRSSEQRSRTRDQGCRMCRRSCGLRRSDSRSSLSR